MKAPYSPHRFFGMMIARSIVFGLFFSIAASALPQASAPTPAPTPTASATLIQFVIATGDDDLRADSQAVAILQTSQGEELERVSLKAANEPVWAAGSIHSATAPLVKVLHPSTDIGQVTIQLISSSGGPLGSDNWNVQSVGAALLESQGQSATALLSASGAPLARLTASQSTIVLKPQVSPLIVWSAKFDQITDPDRLKTLRSDQAQGWAAVLSAWKGGKSSGELLADATGTLDDIEAQIAADQAFLARPAVRGESAPVLAPSLPQAAAASSISAPLADQVATPLHTPLLTGIGRVPNDTTCGPVAGNSSYVECDLAARQQQLFAIGGLIEIVQAYASLLPPTPGTSSFGQVIGPAVATTTIHVISEFALPIGASGSTPTRSYTVSPSVPDLEMAVNDTVTVMLDKNKVGSATGFTLTPTSGVLQFPTGRTHSPHLTLHAIAPGTVTVQYFGAGERNATCGTSSPNWSGYSIPGTPVTGITGSWVVPTVNSKSPSGKSSTWIGIDGCGEPQLIQTGTEQDMNSGFLGFGSGPSYSAWWEVLPQFGSTQSFSSNTPVFPGDAMTAAIRPVGGTPAPNTNSSWTLTLSDATQGWSVSTTQSFSAPLDQAEWIEEATTWCGIGCSVQELADYQTVTFDVGDKVAVGGGTARNPGLAPVNAISMTPSTGDASNNFSTPSIPDCDTDGFTAVPSPIAPLPPGPSFPSASYPTAVVGRPYSKTISTLGAASVSLTGGTSPPGLTFDKGTLSGTPKSIGTFGFTLSATSKNGVKGAACTQPVTLSVVKVPPSPTPQFSNVVITILTGNDDLRNDSDLQVDFTGIAGWLGNKCLVQGNSGDPVPGSACHGGTPGDWTGPVPNNWNGWAAWSTVTETKSFSPGSLSFSGSGSITLTFSTHNTGCSIPFSGCGTTNDNWDIQAMKVDLTGSPVAPKSITLLNVGNFKAAHNPGGCFFRIRPPGANDPSSLTVTLTFPPPPAGNGCPKD
jgi:hypothetical protein